MIYDFPGVSEPIRQGDIFIGLPRIDISLQKMIVVEPGGERLVRWRDINHNVNQITIMVPVRPVAAIVATHDCDTLRARDITLCEIRPFADVERKASATASPKSWKSIITRQARINLKWFYLPPDAGIGFQGKMAADFLMTLRVPRTDLEDSRAMRHGRLNAIADRLPTGRTPDSRRSYPGHPCGLASIK